MAVFRVIKNNDYTIMSNYHLKDKKLSLAAKGLQSFFLSLPDDWDYSINGLISVLKEGKTAIRNALEELKSNGYLIINKVRNEQGKFEYFYNIYERPSNEISKENLDLIFSETEKPDTDKPDMDKPGMDEPDMENQPQINTNKLNTNKTNTKNKNKKKKKEAETEIDKVINEQIQNEEVKEAFYDFVKMRKAIGYPLTTKGTELAINNLYKLSKIKEEQILIINNSIMFNWRGLFPLKPEDKKQLEQPKEYKEINLSEEEYIKKLDERGKRYV